MSDDLKEVRPFMALAETLESSNPIISYYLKKYCIQKVTRRFSVGSCRICQSSAVKTAEC